MQAMKQALWIFLNSITLLASAHAAGFDCTKATSQVEKLICSDGELSKLDDDMAAAYRATTAAPVMADQVRVDQRKWLTERNACSEVPCIKSVYNRRIDELRAARISPNSAQTLEGEYTQRIRQCEGTTSQATGCITSEEGIRLEKRDAGSYYLYVRTRTGSIFHSCEYTGIAKQRGTHLISGSTEYCEVTVSFEAEVVSVSSTGEGCRQFCSAQATLDASNLTKKQPHTRATESRLSGSR